MVKRCCYGLCNSDTRYPERIVNVTFIPFPKPRTAREKCLRWIEACGRPHWQFNETRITKYTYICSKHFRNGKPTEDHPDPLPIDPNNVNSHRQPVKRKKYEFRRNKLKITEKETIVKTEKEIKPASATDETPSSAQTENGCTDVAVGVKMEDDSDMLEYLENSTENKPIDVFLSEVKMESDPIMQNFTRAGTEGDSLRKETFELQSVIEPINDKLAYEENDSSCSENIINLKQEEREPCYPSDHVVDEVNMHSEPGLEEAVKQDASSGNFNNEVMQIKIGCKSSEATVQRGTDTGTRTEYDKTDIGTVQQPAESDSVTPGDGVYAMECFVNKNFVQPSPPSNWQSLGFANTALNQVQHCQQSNSTVMNSSGNTSYRKILPNNGQNLQPLAPQVGHYLVHSPPQLFLLGNTIFQITPAFHGGNNLITPTIPVLANFGYPNVNINLPQHSNIVTVPKEDSTGCKGSSTSSDKESNENKKRSHQVDEGSDLSEKNVKTLNQATSDSGIDFRAFRGKKEVECPVCHKKVNRIKQHYFQVHCENKPIACPVCGKRFTNRGTYNAHMAYHSEQKPHMCSKCGKRFRALRTLRSHELIHDKEKRFKCSHCKKTFSQRHALIYHERSHTGEEPFMCDVCGKSFRAVGNLNVHLRTHSIFPTLKCEKCGKTYNKYKLYRACLRRHYNEEESSCNRENICQNKESTNEEENDTESQRIVNHDDR